MGKAWRSAKLAVCRRIGCGPVGRPASAANHAICRFRRSFLDRVRGGRLHLLIRNRPLMRLVDGCLLERGRRGSWRMKHRICAPRTMKQGIVAGNKNRGGLLCQSEHISRGNGGAPRRTDFVYA
jgi:hypothetical protein